MLNKLRENILHWFFYSINDYAKELPNQFQLLKLGYKSKNKLFIRSKNQPINFYKNLYTVRIS